MTAKKTVPRLAKKSVAKPVESAAGAPAKFTEQERAAMKARALELKAEARASKNRAEGEKAVLAAIAAMAAADRAMARRVHAIVATAAPALVPKTWYGMPAYTRDDKIVCFFRDARKFGDRYATLGFNDKARLDDGAMWPVAYALHDLNPAVEGQIAALVKRAAG